MMLVDSEGSNMVAMMKVALALSRVLDIRWREEGMEYYYVQSLLRVKAMLRGATRLFFFQLA